MIFGRLTIPFALAAAFFLNACTTANNTNTTTDANAPAATTTPATASGKGFVYTADERGNSISVIDLGAGQVRTVPVRIAPHNVQLSRDGRLLLAVGAPAAAASGDHSHAQSQGGEAEQGEHGHGAERRRLLIFDAATMNAEGAADIELGRHPAHVVIDARGEFAYASNSEDDTVQIVDVAQRRAVGR